MYAQLCSEQAEEQATHPEAYLEISYWGHQDWMVMVNLIPLHDRKKQTHQQFMNCIANKHGQAHHVQL